jgi:LysM repeat protein
MKMKPLAFGGLALALVSVGCAHRDLVLPQAIPAAATTPAPTPEAAAPAPAARAQYVVRKGDTLWSIAAQAGVLGDPFRWPLIFRQNRDQVQDPDVIEIAQDLSVVRSTDAQAIRDAIQNAKDTPAYAPHDGPRKQLPLNY